MDDLSPMLGFLHKLSLIRILSSTRKADKRAFHKIAWTRVAYLLLLNCTHRAMRAQVLNAYITMEPKDVCSMSNLGALRFEGTFSFTKTGFSKNKKGTSLSTANFWGYSYVSPVPPAPTFMKEPQRNSSPILCS